MTAGSTDPQSTPWAELLREKRSLAAIVRDAGRLCVQDSVDVVLDVCDELANAHANGIVHGDLGLHRVRTMWPRRPGDCVEIWALDADDTGAIDFRAAFQAPALAPEQRAGRVGDARSDIWAVGAILHALIGGAPPLSGPGRRPVREMLPGAPRALISIVEQCLADDPQARPASVDDVAGALASFASNSPERFQQLARRRIASLKAKHVPAKVTALSRLDELALKRESSGKMLVAPPVQVVQPYPPAPAAIPASPITQPTTGALRPPTRPSYSDAVLPASTLGEPLRKPARSAAFGDDVSVNEWPMMHGIPSASVAVPVAQADAPTRAPRMGTLPAVDPLPPTLTAVALADGQIVPARSFNPNETLRMYMPPPSAAFPSAVPTVASPTPPPVEVDHRASGYGFEDVHAEAGARTPAPYIPPAPQANRPRSYHPPSFGPMAIDVADGVHFPADARIPSFSDLAEYREAKRASRRSATMAVVAAAAVLIVGFSYGARVIKEDRDNMRAAEAAAAHAPAPPPPPAVVLPAAAPTAPVAPSASEAPVAPSAKPAPTAPKAAPARKAAPAPVRKAEPKPDSDAIPRESEFTPGTVFGDAIGKKEPAPANALSDGLK